MNSLKYCPVGIPQLPQPATRYLSGSIFFISSKYSRSDSDNHSLHSYVVVIAYTFCLGISKNFAFKKLVELHGLNVTVICINNSGGNFPRNDSSIRSNSSSFNSNASSHQHQHRNPLETVIDVIFIGSSQPLNMIRCPVGMYSNSNGFTLLFQYLLTSNRFIAHCNCAKHESFSVAAVFLITNTFALGYSINRQIKFNAVVVDFLLARLPFTTR